MTDSLNNDLLKASSSSDDACGDSCGDSCVDSSNEDLVNPVEQFLRSDRVPHIWCPGCGIGTTVNSFARALIESKIDLRSLALVSGIGCTGRVAGKRSQIDFRLD